MYTVYNFLTNMRNTIRETPTWKKRARVQIESGKWNVQKTKIVFDNMNSL